MASGRDAKTQGEGVGEEIKGKVQNTWGKVKDAVGGMKHDDVERDEDSEKRDIEDDRERDVA